MLKAGYFFIIPIEPKRIYSGYDLKGFFCNCLFFSKTVTRAIKSFLRAGNTKRYAAILTTYYIMIYKDADRIAVCAIYRMQF